MEMHDYIELFYASHYVPVICQREGEQPYLAGYPEGIIPVIPQFEPARISVPILYKDSDLGFYGMIHHRECDLIFGPVFDTEVSQDMVRLYMKENIIPYGQIDDVFGFLARIPHLSYNQFLNMLGFVYYTLNGERPDIFSHFAEGSAEEIGISHQEALYENRDLKILHGTYLFEEQMLSFVKAGNPEGLQRFLLQAAAERPLNAGVVADSPLRQAKNTMLGLIPLVGKTAAIPGGMDVERAYHLMDSYALECERQRTVDSVTALQFQMILDFAERVGQSKMPSGYTPEVYACVQYINAHLNEPIEIDDLASHISRSRSYVTTHFKQEIGSTVADYITAVRIREAKGLLRYSDKTLSEISEYLCFSSQPHFQRVFKQETGLTPAEYRRQKKT